MKKALLVVDVQNDFCPGGALAVDRGDEVVPVINDLIERGNYEIVVFSRDWHPAESPHFKEWPVHCVEKTEGAMLHRELKTTSHARCYIINKGMYDDGYSMFTGDEISGSSLHALLARNGIELVDVVGLATDHCVKATVLDALRHGWETRVVLSACRAVKPGDGFRALDEMFGKGANIIWNVL